MTTAIGIAVALAATTGIGLSPVFGAIGCYYFWIGFSNIRSA
jgi:hypothetical protein